MSILQTIDQYEDDNVYFCDSIKNNVMTNGYFIRILYCMPICTMNGIYLHVDFNEVTYEKYYQKYKCYFDIEKCTNMLNKIYKIEKCLLEKVSHSICDKDPQYKLSEQLKFGYVKLFCETPPKQTTGIFMLKISGIWETDMNYGLTYKFTRVSSVI